MMPLLVFIIVAALSYLFCCRFGRKMYATRSRRAGPPQTLHVILEENESPPEERQSASPGTNPGSKPSAGPDRIPPSLPSRYRPRRPDLPVKNPIPEVKATVPIPEEKPTVPIPEERPTVVTEHTIYHIPNIDDLPPKSKRSRKYIFSDCYRSLKKTWRMWRMWWFVRPVHWLRSSRRANKDDDVPVSPMGTVYPYEYQLDDWEDWERLTPADNASLAWRRCSPSVASAGRS